MPDRRDDALQAALGRPEGLVRGGGAAGLAARLERWVADARVEEAAEQRSRERWLREVAGQEATLSGVLADLAERRVGVSIGVGGRRHHGTIAAIGVDFVALRLVSGADVLVAVGAIGVVRTAPTVAAAAGDRMLTTELRLADVLAELAAERERVRLVTTTGEAAAGQLQNVGHDVVVLRVDAEPRGSAYVPLATIAEVTLS
jgi:hypothetical protein